MEKMLWPKPSNATGCLKASCHIHQKSNQPVNKSEQRGPPMTSSGRSNKHLPRPHLSLIMLIGVIVPRRLRADWRQEWEAELRNRENLLADWDRLNWN